MINDTQTKKQNHQGEKKYLNEEHKQSYQGEKYLIEAHEVKLASACFYQLEWLHPPRAAVMQLQAQSL